MGRCPSAHTRGARLLLLFVYAAGAIEITRDVRGLLPSSACVRLLLWQVVPNGIAVARKYAYLFEPFTATLRKGVEAVRGANCAALVHAIVPVTSNEAALRSLVASDMGPGDLFVQLGPYGLDAVPWRPIADKGVRTVYYQTEPLRFCFSARNRPILEIWDYSRCNMRLCDGMAKASAHVRRHVPAGVVRSPLAHHAKTPPPLVFLTGTLTHSRRECVARLTEALGGDHLVVEQGTWSDSALGELVERQSIFLNLHRECLSTHPCLALEPRVVKMLNSGALVVSQHSVEDEPLYVRVPGVVFANLSEIPEAYRRFVALSAEERSNIARISREAMAQDMSPESIFRRSGLDAVIAMLASQKARPNAQAQRSVS